MKDVQSFRKRSPVRTVRWSGRAIRRDLHALGGHDASPRGRGRSRPQPPARHRADRRRLCGRPRLRRRGGPLSRRDRALRRGDPRHRPAQDGRHLGAGGLAARRPRHAGADAHRARPLERQGAGLRRRRRRLRRQAVPSRGGAGAHPRAAAPLGRPRQERVPVRAGAARHAHRPRHRRRQSGQAHLARIPAARPI